MDGLKRQFSCDGVTADGEECDKTFSRPSTLKRHKENVHDKATTKSFSCRSCAETFGRKENMLRHQRDQHGCGSESRVTCSMCGRAFRSDYARKHETTCLRKATKSTAFAIQSLLCHGNSLQIQWPESPTQPKPTEMLLTMLQPSPPTPIAQRHRLTFIPYRTPDGLSSNATQRDRTMVLLARHFEDAIAKGINNKMLSDIHDALSSGISAEDVNNLTADMALQSNDYDNIYTFLEAATVRSDLRNVERIIRIGLPYEGGVLTRAARHKRNDEMVDWFLREAPQRAFDSETLLEYVSAKLHLSRAESIAGVFDIDKLRHLLERGIEPSQTLMKICFHFSAEGAIPHEMLTLLRDYGARLDCANEVLLARALRYESVGAMRILFEFGARADTRMHSRPDNMSYGKLPPGIQDIGAKRKLIKKHAACQGVVVEWLKKYEEDEVSDVKRIWNTVVTGNEVDFAGVLPRIEEILKYGLSPNEFDAITVQAARQDADNPSASHWTILALAVDRCYMAAARRMVQMGFATHNQYEALWHAAAETRDEQLMRMLLRSALDADELDQFPEGAFSQTVNISDDGCNEVVIDPLKEAQNWKATLLVAAAAMPRVGVFSDLVQRLQTRNTLTADWIEKALCVATEHGHFTNVHELLDVAPTPDLDTVAIRADLTGPGFSAPGMASGRR